MTTEISPTQSEVSSNIPIGAKLRAAREARNIDRKDVAHQLRLKEDIIAKLEKDDLPGDMHVTFLRGYIRSYGKYLELSESEIKSALEPIKPKPLFTPEELVITKKHTRAIDSNSPIVRIFTFSFVFLMAGLVAVRWFNHTQPTTTQELLASSAPAEIIHQDFRDNLPLTNSPMLATNSPTSIKESLPPITIPATKPPASIAKVADKPLPVKVEEKPAIEPAANVAENTNKIVKEEDTAKTVAATKEAKPTVNETEDDNVPAYARKAQKLASAKPINKTSKPQNIPQSSDDEALARVY